MAVFSGSLPSVGDLNMFYPAIHIPRIKEAAFIITYSAVQPPWDRNRVCGELEINVQAISHSVVRVTFTSPVINNFALTNVQNYQFSPSLTVLSVTPNTSIAPTYVDLAVEGLTGQTYTLNILTVEAV